MLPFEYIYLYTRKTKLKKNGSLFSLAGTIKGNRTFTVSANVAIYA